MNSPTSPSANHAGIHFVEFVALIALLMALTALSIDIMLTALPQIAGSYAVASANDRQFVITAYMVGFAIGQPLFGPLSDRFGRKPLLGAGLGIFALGSIAAAFAPDFEMLLAARALQGFGAASPRVIAAAVVRDRFAGREMARVMSFAMMIFIIVPVVAPMLGVGILQIGPWPLIFGFLFLAGAVALGWAALRLPETLPAERRIALSVRSLGSALAQVVTTRRTIGYTVALGFLFGTLICYITSAQQIFVDVYGLEREFPLLFGAMASVMAAASLINGRLVGRLGMQRISHIALIGFLAVCGAMALAGFPKEPPVTALVAFFAATLFFFGLIVPNFNAMAMQPVGHIAGTASSFAGFYSTAAGAVLGGLVAHAFDGTVRPLLVGFAALGLLTLATVLVTEKGRLVGAGD